jgi:hypothetical protein
MEYKRIARKWLRLNVPHRVSVGVLCSIVVTTSHAGNYVQCLLDNMPGSTNNATTAAVYRKCIAEFPTGANTVVRGSGRGMFSFDNPDACILKKARDTQDQRAAGLISFACYCLYGEPQFPGQGCAK